MTEIELADFLACGRMRSGFASFKSKHEDALQMCAEALTSHKAPFVSISGGKSSAAAAFVVDAAARIVDRDFVLFVCLADPDPPDVADTCLEIAEMTGRHLDICQYPCGYHHKKPDKALEYASEKDLCFMGAQPAQNGWRISEKKHLDIDVVFPLQHFDLYDIAALYTVYDIPTSSLCSKVIIGEI